VGAAKWAPRRPIGSHMLVSKTKQCMSKHKLVHNEAANSLQGYLCTNMDRKSVAYRFFKRCQKSLRSVRFRPARIRFMFLFS